MAACLQLSFQESCRQMAFSEKYDFRLLRRESSCAILKIFLEANGRARWSASSFFSCISALLVVLSKTRSVASRERIIREPHVSASPCDNKCCHVHDVIFHISTEKFSPRCIQTFCISSFAAVRFLKLLSKVICSSRFAAQNIMPIVHISRNFDLQYILLTCSRIKK